MKKTAIILSLCLAICAVFFSIEAPAAKAATRINVATSFNLGHPVMRRVLKPWADEVRHKTNGQVDIHFFNPGVLTDEREHFSAVKNGEIGAGHAPVNTSLSKLLVTSVMDLPTGMTNCLAASEAFWLLYSSSPEMQSEFRGIKVLAMHASAPYQLNMVKTNVRILADLKNKKILATPGGDSARLLRSLSGSPLMTPAQDFSISLSRGMADGCILPMPQLRAAGLQGHLKTITLCNLRMDAYWLGMNMDIFNALPPEAQKVLNELSGQELSLSIARVFNDLNNLARAELLKEDLTLNELNPGERKRWLGISVPPMLEHWVSQLKRHNIDTGMDIWNRAQAIYQESENKWAGRASQQITPQNNARQ